MFDTQKVGRNIAQLRKNANMTQVELADKMNISYQAASNWERGVSMPDISRLPELAEIFNCTIDEIVGCRSELIHHIIACDTEAHISDNCVKVSDITSAIPVIKPQVLDSLIESIPKSDATVTIADIAAVAPLVESPIISAFATKITEKVSLQELANIIIFLDDRSKEHLCSIIDESTITFHAIKNIIIFLSDDIKEQLLLKLKEPIALHEFGDIVIFLPERIKHKLIGNINPDTVNFDSIAKVAVYCNADIIDHLVDFAIKNNDYPNKNNLCAPFMKKETLQKLFHIAMQKQDFSLIKEMAVFI